MIFLINKVLDISKYCDFIAYNHDRLNIVDFFNFFCKFKINFKLINFNKLFFSFLSGYRVFYLCDFKFSRLLNTYIKYFDCFVGRSTEKNIINILESVNFFCKFSYSAEYNKLVIKFSKYDIKLIVFRSYGNNYSRLLFDDFININNKNDKIYIIDSLNSFSSSIKNIKRRNDYTGKGIRYLNEMFNVKVRKKIK